MARSVTIGPGKVNIQMPNGGLYNAGAIVVLTNAQFAQIPASLIPATVSTGTDVGGEIPRTTNVVAGKNVQMPNGYPYDAPKNGIVLTAAQYAQLNQALVPGTITVDP